MNKYQLIISAFFLFMVAAGCVKKKDAGKTGDELHRVAYTDLRDAITQTGEVRPVVKIDLKSEASGEIKKIHVKEGALVKKGEKLLEIDPTGLVYRKKLTALSLERAAIEQQISKRNLDDGIKLSAVGSIAQRQIDDLQSKCRLAEIQLQEVQLQLADINEQLAKTTVVSPINGVVTSLMVKEGEIAVSATGSSVQGGTALATIADISQLEVVSKIGEVDYVHLREGQKVLIKSSSSEGLQTSGTISFVAMSAKKEQADDLGTFEVRILIDSLIPGIATGITVNVDFLIMEKKHVLAIPNRSVVKKENGTFVLKKDSSAQKPRLVAVSLGATDYRNYEVLSGLAEGDMIIGSGEPATGTKQAKKGTDR
ncbi:MAG: efflux RND transporter periplasmic adaptor subunit [Chitinivibrionales bacterium]|nr:efflux RND transporter periplasmic adaptor subunit [Chitinivibrionales bacterium]